MTAILGAMTAGYSAQQILRYLSQHNPTMANQISAALNAGYSADHVLRYMNRQGKRIGKLIPDEQQQERSGNLFQNAKNNVHTSLLGGAKALGTALGATAAIGGGAYALSHAIPRSLQAGISRVGFTPQNPPLGPGPNSPGVQVLNPAPGQPPIPGANYPGPGQPQRTATTNPISATSQPPISPSPLVQGANVTQQPISPQPINPQRDINKSVDILKNFGEDARVKNLLSGGLPSKDIAGVLKTVMPKDKYKAMEAQEGGVEGIINDYAQATQQKPQELSPMEPRSAQLDERQQAPEMAQEAIEPKVIATPKPIEKNAIVSSPQGVGEVKEIRNGKALVEVDGKIHKVDEEQLIQSPLAQDELADLHDNLLRGIERHTGQDVSKNVEWAGYDPKLNELAYKPWMGGGKVYTYSDISSEDVTELQNIMAERKTSGGNFVGAWEKDTKSPIGNRMHALITKLQKERGGKGNEYRSKYETIYDPTEPAKKAAQERYKNERKAQKTGQQQPRNSSPSSHLKQHETKEKEDPKEKLIKEYEEDGDKVYSAQIPTSEIVARPKLMQFKAISEHESGENPLDTLKGKFDTLKSGVLLLWKPKDPSKYDMSGNQKFIVANGHHRLAFAKRENHPKMLTRIIKEEDGYTASDAMRLGAEINIAEGRGTVYDQAKYFRDTIATHGKTEASLGASKTGAPGQRAWTIAANAQNELFETFINEDIKPEQAEAIALSTDNKDRQSLGLKFAREGKSADQIKNLLEASKTIKKRPDDQMSLFGYDDSAFKAIEEMGEAATKIQRDINQSLASITGASRNPHKAKQFGVDVKDPEAVKEARNRLNKEKERWKSWSAHSDLVAQVKQSLND